MRQRFTWLFCLVLVLSLVLPSTLAQDDLTETFVDENGVFTVMYPAGWVEGTSGDLQTVSNGATGVDNVTVGFIGPADIPTGASAQDILVAVQTDLGFEGEVAPATVDNREAATLSVDQGTSSGFFLVIQFENGDYGLMAALGDISALNANIGLIMDIAETFNNVGATGEGSGSTGSSTTSDRRVVGEGDPPVFPQSYAFGDETIVYYPSSWDYREDDNGYIHVFDDDTDIIFTFYGPGAWEDMGAPAGDLAALMAYSYNPIDENIAFDPDNVELITLYGRDAAVYQYEENLDGDTYQRILFTLNYDICDSAIQVSAVPRFDYDFVDLDMVYDIAASFDFSQVVECFDPRDDDDDDSSSSSSTTTTQSGDKPQSLSDYASANWRDAVAELESEGLIASGGTLVFNENSAFRSGQGNFFTTLARNQPFTDIVMAGTITFTVGDLDQFESCTLLARVVANSQGDAEQFTEAGITNEGEIVIAEHFDPNEDADVLFLDQTVSVDEDHHFLMLLQGDKLTLYVDGELAVEDFIVQERAGTYGIALRGRGPSASCRSSNVWVVEAPVFEPGVCKVSATGTVNKRSGPGTNFDRAGTLTAGVTLDVVGQASPGDGFVWWKLEDDTWVREDVVNVRGDCANLPVVDD